MTEVEGDGWGDEKYDPRNCKLLGECRIKSDGEEAPVKLFKSVDDKYVMREKAVFGGVSPPYEPEEAKELIVDEDLERLNF